MITQSRSYKDGDNIYLNITFQPNYMSNTPYLLEYNVTKDTPILEKMSDYYISVIRFDIPLGEIPTTIMPIIPNQPNPNLSPLIIGVSYNNINYPQNVIYVSQDIISIISPIQNKPTQVVTKYYYIYSYYWMIELINTALLLSYNSSTLPLLFPGSTPPYFTYEPSTQLISLIVPKFFVKLTAPALSIPKININYSLFQYLESFTWESNVLNLAKFEYSLSTTYLKDINGYALFGTLPSNPPEYYKITQSELIIQYWNPITKILLTSDTIPILKEFVQASNLSGLSPNIPIISDFTPIITRSGDGRSTAYYLPSAEYRKIDMLSDLPLNKISIKVYWEDIYGNINQLAIGSFLQANLKIAFLHKSMYKNKN